MATGDRRVHRTAVAVVLGMVLGTLTYAAVKADGFKAAEVTLHESGIWMTKGAVIGRYNHQLGKVDTQSSTFGDESVDVQQYDSTVLVVTQSPPQLSRYDVAMNARIGTALDIPVGSVVSIGGGNGALLDPATSRLWFTSGDALPSVKPDTDEGSVEVPGATGAVVGADGAVHVFAADTGTVWTLDEIFTNVSTLPRSAAEAPTETTIAAPDDSQPPADDVETEVTRAARVLPDAAGATQISAAGDRIVLLDPETGTLTVGDDSFEIDGVDAASRLQQPSPDRDHVVIATSASLLLVDVGSHDATVLGDDTDGDGSPVQPVWLAGCAYGAWATHAVRYCDDTRLNEVAPPTPTPQTARRFRVNHGLVVLNYVSGAWLDMSPDGKITFNDDWSAALQSEIEQDEPETAPDEQSDVNTCSFDPDTPNVAPVAVDDVFGARTDVPTILDVLSGVGSGGQPDADQDCDVLTVALESTLAEAGGTLANGAGTIKVVDSGRRFQYQPAADAESLPGPFSFGYLLSDGINPAVRATASVNLLATAANADPEPHDDATSVAQGRTVEINVLGNDFDPDGDALAVTDAQIIDNGNPVGVNGPDGDSLIWQANGRLSYRAPASVTKQQTIRYTVSDGRAVAGAEVEISVIPGGSGQNKDPNTLNDAIVGVAGQNLWVDVVANDSDPNNDPLRLVKVDAVAGLDGTPPPVKWSANTGGVVALDAAPEGEHSYAYQITDGAGGVAWGRLRIIVLPQGENHAPVGVRDDAVAVQGKASLADVLANDADIDGDVLMITQVQGMVDADGVRASDAVSVEVLEHRMLRITPKSAAVPGTVYRFTYRVSDGQEDDSAVVAVRVAAPSPGQSPVAGDDEAVVHLGGAVGIPVLRNDYDPDADPITIVPSSVQITSSPAIGQLFAQGDRVVYVAPSPSEQATGSTVFGSYAISDGQRTVQAKLTISVRTTEENSPPDPPDVLVRVFAGQHLTIALPRYGLDPDGDPVEVIGQTLGSSPRGRVAYDPASQTFAYDAPLTTGQDAFQFDLRDSPAGRVGAVGTLTVRISVAEPVDNSAPVAVDDTFEVEAGKTTAIPVLVNDTDPDGDAILFAPQAAVDQPRSGAGSVAVAADGKRIDFTATGDAGTSADFQYRIVDERGSSPVLGTVHVEVVESVENKPPVARDDLWPAMKSGDVVQIDVLRNDSDPENDPLSVQCGVEAAGYCTPIDVTVDGVTRQGLQVTMGETSLSFTYIVSDAAHADLPSGAARAAVQIPLLSTNRPPTCDVQQVDIGAEADDPFTVTIDVGALCTDPDGDPVVLWRETKPAIASGTAITGPLEWDAENSFTFSRDVTASGEAVVRYQVQDDPAAGEPAGATGDVVLAIVGNSPPTAQTLNQTIESGASPVTVNLATAITDPDPGDVEAMVFGDVTGSDAQAVLAELSGNVLTLQAPRSDLVVDGGEPKTFTIGYTATDPQDNEVQGTINVVVTASNKPGPTARDDRIADVKQGDTGSVNVLANDLPGDAGDPVISELIVTTPDVTARGASGTAGTVHIDADGNAVFTPTPEFHGPATFSYTIQDGRRTPSKQATANVTVNVLDKPDQPAQPSVGDQESGVARVTFAATPDNGSPITTYAVTWAGGSKDCGAAAGECVVTGLTNGDTYTFQVTATNDVGTSDPSIPSPPYTPDQVPDQPPAPAADWGDGSATVTWAGITNPGSPLVAVRIDVSPSDVASWTGPGETSGSHEFTGLTNGTPYTFTVTAVNSAKPNGESLASTPSAAVTPAGPPGSIEAPTLAEGDGLVTASWGPADPNGDPAGLTYTVKLMNGSTVERTVGPLTARTTAIQATNGQTYRVVVEIDNKYTLRAGAPVGSPPSNEIVPSGKPKAPASVSVTQNLPGAARIEIGPTANNGAPIDFYTVTASGGGGTQQVTSDGTGTTTYDFPGLNNGQAYTFTVTAHNKNGNGDPTTSGNSAVPYTSPQAPSVNCTSNGSYVTCTWSTNAANGPAPVSTTVTIAGSQVSTQASGSWTSQSLGYSTSVTAVVRVCNSGTNGPANPCTDGSHSASSARPPTPAPSCSASGTAVNCSWSITGLATNDPHSTTVTVDGVGTVSTADSGSWSSGNIGYSASRTIRVKHCKTTTGECVEESASATTTTPPRVVWTTRGRDYGACPSNGSVTCYYIVVHITGFAAGSYGITCFPGEAGYEMGGGSITSGGYTGEYTKEADCVADGGANGRVSVGGVVGNGVGHGW